MKKVLFIIFAVITAFFSSCNSDKPEYQNSELSLSYMWDNVYCGTYAFHIESNEVVISAHLSERWANKEIILEYNGEIHIFQKEDNEWSSVTTDYSEEGEILVCYKPIPSYEERLLKKIYENF